MGTRNDIQVQIRHTEARDSVALQEIHAQTETYIGTLQIPYPSEGDWNNRLVNIPQGSKSLVAEIDGKVVGNAAIICSSTSPRRRHVAEIALVVHKDWRRKGVGAALMDSIIDLSDNWMNLLRLELTVFVDNAAAISLYEHYGFEVEGTLRQFAFRNGQFVNAFYMARLSLHYSPRNSICAVFL